MAGKQYRVITEKGNRFTGAFDSKKLEGRLNCDGADGWHVVGSTWRSMSSQVVVIMERDSE